VGKAVGGSVQRHRAARRIRAALAGEIPGLADGTLVVVRALPGADTDPGLSRDVAAAVAAATAKALRVVSS
jgi:ribonuclease P protein component